MMADDTGEVAVAKCSDHLGPILNVPPHHGGFVGV
jgi:hypothetical protein